MKDEFPVHTLISRENREGGLLLCGINHGYSKEDERQDAAGIDRSDNKKSFFSDGEVNDYPYRNRIVSWFSLWGYELALSEEMASDFDRSIVQANWLQTCSRNMAGINTRQACIEDNNSFFQVCNALCPRVIFFFGKELISAFNSPELGAKVEGIFGARKSDINWFQKDVFWKRTLRRRFRIGFQQYEKLVVVSLPHASGARGVADDYIEAFKPEMSNVIDSWWKKHKEKLSREQIY